MRSAPAKRRWERGWALVEHLPGERSRATIRCDDGTGLPQSQISALDSPNQPDRAAINLVTDMALEAGQVVIEVLIEVLLSWLSF